jgi:hypothetical protein
MNNGQQAANPFNPNVNNQMRAILLATAPKFSKNIGTFTGAAGSVIRAKLFNVGILTGLRFQISQPVTIGVAAATASQKAPYNLINNVQVTDYNGTARANLSGFALWALNSYRRRAPFGLNNESETAVMSNPVVPTAVGNGTVSFYGEIPIAYDAQNDLRGAILAQTAVGDMYATFTLNPTLLAQGDVDAVYTGAGTTTVVENGDCSITIWQDFLLPQAVNTKGQIPLPALDLATVYELAGNIITTDNIIENAQKLINYPNLRSVYGSYINFVNNKSLAAVGSLGSMQIIANGNNVIRDETEGSKYFEQRNYLNGDLLPGVFAWLHRKRPIETALFGNVQAGLTPIVALTNPYMEVTWESFYTQGQALPGQQQGS